MCLVRVVICLYGPGILHILWGLGKHFVCTQFTVPCFVWYYYQSSRRCSTDAVTESGHSDRPNIGVSLLFSWWVSWKDGKTWVSVLILFCFYFQDLFKFTFHYFFSKLIVEFQNNSENWPYLNWADFLISYIICSRRLPNDLAAVWNIPSRPQSPNTRT